MMRDNVREVVIIVVYRVLRPVYQILRLYRRNFNMIQKIKNTYHYQSGFTLVELLIVIVLVGLLGGVAVTILTLILRTDTQASVSLSVQQNGDYIISQFTNTVRNASHFIAVSNAPSTDCTINSSGSLGKVSGCYYSNGDVNGNMCNAASAYSLIEFIGKDGVTKQGFTCQNNTINLTTFSSGSSSPKSLVDPSIKVDTGTCQITCNEQLGSPPIIGISFTLDSTQASVTTQNATQKFTTNVYMRNL